MMDVGMKALEALWQVVVVGLLLGAGLPALFALGIRFLETGRVPARVGVPSAGAARTVPSTAGKIGAAVCFGLCVLAVGFGIVVIVFGDQLFP